MQTSDALPSLVFPVTVWKGEYNAAVSDRLYVEARLGAYLSDAVATATSIAPRISDTGANAVSGGALSFERRINRPQANGSVSYMKRGWGGSHTFRIGGEYMADHLVAPTTGYGNPCNCVSTLNNTVPTQVQIFLGANVSKNDLTTLAGFADDTWRVAHRVTLSMGLRLDRYQPSLPAQEGPAGQPFTAVDPVLTFSNWGPRAGMSVDLTGDGKTVLKVHYGKYWLYPGTNFTSAFNPNPSGWSQTYLWTSDANGNGRWDQGEQGPLTAVSGGSAATQTRCRHREHLRASDHRLRRARGGTGSGRPDRCGPERQTPAIRHHQRQPAAERLLGAAGGRRSGTGWTTWLRRRRRDVDGV